VARGGVDLGKNELVRQARGGAHRGAAKGRPSGSIAGIMERQRDPRPFGLSELSISISLTPY